ncbi:Caffeic acid 3-O-methyltransferase [Apostasia shenzhenica]|uniref:Caffeic acid 3-O-methyltransferase n=1 Tax=Apostasia shenzhenica TaxID=1088818 RepID=A0A2I0AV56_9ASPA|nr:Caffeic acid 3-O-methyltransferase [Apostasia shenzhenica]
MAASGDGKAAIAPPEDRRQIKKAARLAMMEISNMLSVPMALNAVVRLGVPNAMWQSGSNSPLTAGELLSRLRPTLPSTASPENLQRLLRLLASHGVFAEHLAGADRRYNLTEVGRTLVDEDEEIGGISYAPYVLQHHQDSLLRAWPLLHEAVRDPAGPEPFARANGGVPAYAYYGGNEAANDLMRKAMWGVSAPFMESFLDEYGVTGGFEGVKVLVDVGGSSGACLQMILRRIPSITAGVNFDLPEVVAGAPVFPGAISDPLVLSFWGWRMTVSTLLVCLLLLKWILTTWMDEECKLILKNCYAAVPAGGKVIICEPVLPEETDGSCRTRALLEGDVFVMTIYRSQGKERTEDEFRQLALAAGFSGFRALYFDPFYTVMELLKE